MKVAVGPTADRWAVDAIARGGGELVSVRHAEGLIWTSPSDVDQLQAFLSDGPGIEWVQLSWAGVEPFAEIGVLNPGLTWTSGKGLYGRFVAEHALALALAGLRGMKKRSSATSWGTRSGTSLIGKRVTILGAGGVGWSIANLLRPLDCELTVVRRGPEPLSGVGRTLGLSQRIEAVRGAAAVFIALPLTAETRGVIGREELANMRADGWLINVARGDHIVTPELIAALDARAIGGAALDVTDPEPLPDGHPLWRMSNCIITPHTAVPDSMGRGELASRITTNVRRFSEGEMLEGLVDVVEGY